MHILMEEERRSYPKEAGEIRPQDVGCQTGGLLASAITEFKGLALLHCISFELQLALHSQGSNHQT